MNKIFLTIFATLLLCTLPFVVAAPAGASVTSGQGTTLPASSVGQANTTGGNVTGVNISGTFSTTRWGGFYGDITANLALGDSGSSTFYSWTVTNFTGAYVYATNATTSFGALQVMNESNNNMPSYINTVAADNFTNTFNGTDNFSSNSLALTDVRYANTYQNGIGGSLRTYAMYDTADSAGIWAGEAANDAAGFGPATVDYQIIAPADTSVVTYNFYLELP